jgi:hypothetical protein
MATVKKPSKPKRVREWVPSCFLLVHDKNVSSTVRYTPMHLRRNEEAGYFSSFKIYGNSPINPIWKTESDRLPLNSVFSVDSARIAGELGVERLFQYGEAYNWSPDFAPPDPNISMPSHLHYSSTDGSFHGHLASFFIFGMPRRIERGDFYYDSFPAARADDELYPSVYLLNPFVRPSAFWVQLVTKDGEIIEAERRVIKGKGASEWSGKDVVLSDNQNPIGIIVKSELKTTTFFTTRTRRDDKMVGLDHGHPFLSQVLNHVNPVTISTVPNPPYLSRSGS